MPARPEVGAKYLRFGEAAKRLGVTRKTLRGLVARGEIPVRWRGGQREFSMASIVVYSQKTGVAKIAEEAKDAIAFTMMREGRSDEAIVIALSIPLARVLELRRHQEGAAPMEDRDPETDRREELAIEERRRTLSETLNAERLARRRMLGG